MPFARLTAPTTSIKNLTSPKAQELKQLLNSYIDLVNDSNSIQNMIEGTKSFRKLLSIKQSPPIQVGVILKGYRGSLMSCVAWFDQAVIETRILPRIVMFLDAFQVPTLQFEAAWMLTNVASGKEKWNLGLRTLRCLASGYSSFFMVRTLNDALLQNRNSSANRRGSVVRCNPKVRCNIGKISVHGSPRASCLGIRKHRRRLGAAT